MSKVWDALIDLKEHYIETFDRVAEEYQEPGLGRFNHPSGGWVNRVWRSDNFRRAHVDVVDARKEKKIWMMHVVVLPHTNNDGPIYGFDVVAGEKLMTGAFHDFSPTVNFEHDMMEYFSETVKPLQWKRERQLPEWAKAIFSDDMVAASAVKQQHEIEQVIDTAKTTLDYFIENIGKYNNHANIELGAAAQNHYAHYQKQNPHTPRVMKSLGLDENDVDEFIQKALFPEV